MAWKALAAYAEETSHPVYSAALVLPFVLTYHVGVWALQSPVINGGDALIRRALMAASPHWIVSTFASVIVLGVCFLVWQFWSKASWKVDPHKLGLMLIESLVIAELFFHLMGWLSVRLPRAQAALTGVVEAREGQWTNLVLYCGAGVYEELVFRVILLGLLMLALTHMLQMETLEASIWSVAGGATLFALFHYVGPGADRFEWNGFLQRTFAGVFFAALYMGRNFGVAAAAHALYDVRVGLAQMW